MKSPTVFVFAPQGAGKTANAEALRGAGSSSLVDAVDLLIKLSDSLVALDPMLTRDDAEHLAKKRVLALLSDADVLRCAALIDKAAAGSRSL